MQSIGQMMNCRRDSDGSTKLITPQEARARGIPWRYDPPATEKCQYCGKELNPVGVIIGSEVALWSPYVERCDCEQARRFQQEHEKQRAAKEAAELEEERRKAARRKIETLLGKSGIKKRFLQRTFENFRCDTPGRKQSYKAAKAYADNFAKYKAVGEGIYIEGSNGTGKTHLAVAIALQLINEGVPVICKTSGDLLLDIKKTFSGDFNTESEVLDVYRTVDLLIIDDFGKEQCSDWSMSTLYTILNDRYEDMLPTIITTNYKISQLANALTPKGADNTKIVAIISRLRETNAILTMEWGDCRGY